jgi:hypothetical protein
VIVLGVGGKMGPSLSRMIRRAFDAAGVKHRGDRRLAVRRAAGGGTDAPRPAAAKAARRLGASRPCRATCSTKPHLIACQTRPTSSTWPA